MKRFSAFICMLLGVVLSVNVFAQNQTVTFSQEKMKISEVFSIVEKQTGLSIAYNEDLLDVGRLVTLPPRKKLSDAMKTILEGTGTRATYQGKLILIVKDNEVKDNQLRTYTGIVRDDAGAVAGAVVMIGSGQVNAVTGPDGEFSIRAKSGEVLRVTMLGYKDAYLSLGSRTENLEITLALDKNMLNESLVVGYGSMQKKDITSAIGSYKPSELSSRQVLGADELLQGRIPGVNITSASGIPGSKNRVSIRGIGSLTAGNEPLYVIDGVPISNTSADAGGWSAQSMNGLSEMNPSDIESIQVLKDAASAAIYGSRATNGVIIITTKKGAKGAPKVAVDASMSLSQLTRTDRLDMADADLYLEVMNEAIDNYNMQTGSTVERLDNPYPGKPQVKMLDMILRTAFTWNANVSVSGGTDKANYYLAANARHNEGVFIGNELDKYNFKTNVSTDIKKWLSVGATVNLSYSRNNRVPTGYDIGSSLIPRALEQRPWDSPVNADGSYNKGGSELLNHNPLQILNEENVYIKNFRMYGSAYAKFNICRGLSFKTSFGGDFMSTEEHIHYTSQHNYGKSVGVLTDARKSYTSMVVENVLSYNRTFADSFTLDAVLGHSFQMDDISTAKQTGQGFPSDSFDVNSVAAEYVNVSTGMSAWALQSYFLRTTLNWKNRYLMTLTMRADGSSKFAKDNRYGYFPSVSAGWNISEEPFWNAESINAKIRASYGSTGNQGGIGSYAWQALAAGGYNYMGVNGLGLSSQGNKELRWEVADQYDVGVDFSFFDGALTFTADAFIKDTRNLLYSKPTAATAGYTTFTSNIGSMRNKGIELAIGGNVGKGDFNWKGDFNISFIRNRLTSLIDDNEVLPTDSMHALKVGKEVGSFYLIKMNGIYQYDEDVPQNLYDQGVRAGDCIYEDVNGDGEIDTANDRQFVGSANPKFSGGFNNTFSFRGFDLSIFFTFSYGSSLYELWTGGYRLGNGVWTPLKSEALKRWTGPGTTNDTPRAIYGYTWNSTKFANTRFLHDASYLRCRNLSLGYTLPSRITSKAGIDKLRFFFQVDNLFIATPYPLLDPEVNVSLNAMNMGYDFLYPSQPRTFSLGLNLKF